MGVVHLADDLVLDREVAVKVIEDRHPALVRREARIMAMVSHESVVQFYAHGENYLVMEYIDGHPLEILRLILLLCVQRTKQDYHIIVESVTANMLIKI